MSGCEIVVAFKDFAVSAVWTTDSSVALEDVLLPLVTFGAEPPNLLVAADADMARSEVAVFGRVPLLREPRIETGEIVRRVGAPLVLRLIF